MGESDVLPEAVKRLVHAHVRTPAHLEALVAVARTPERTWRAEEIATSTFVEADVLASALQEMAAGRLLEVSESGGIGPAGREQKETLAQLVSAYARTPVQLVRAVYSRPTDPVQSFADAFRLNRPK